jgi:hypothetical protein
MVGQDARPTPECPKSPDFRQKESLMTFIKTFNLIFLIYPSAWIILQRKDTLPLWARVCPPADGCLRRNSCQKGFQIHHSGRIYILIGNAIFEYCDFVKPISIVPLAAIGYNKSISFKGIPSYCKIIHFPNGREISDYIESGEPHPSLIRADVAGFDDIKREKKFTELSDKYASLLRQNIIEDEEFINRIGGNVPYLLITEMIDNINEHANPDHIFLFSQHHSGTNYCEICLVDDGMGIFKSLSNAGRDVLNDLDALQKVILETLSAKDEFGSIKRGTGIRNTISLLSNNELKGFFAIISGKTGYFTDYKSRNQFVNFQNFYWPGTIIDMGFSKPQQNINVYEYIR